MFSYVSFNSGWHCSTELSIYHECGLLSGRTSSGCSCSVTSWKSIPYHRWWSGHLQTYRQAGIIPFKVVDRSFQDFCHFFNLLIARVLQKDLLHLLHQVDAIDQRLPCFQSSDGVDEDGEVALDDSQLRRDVAVIEESLCLHDGPAVILELQNEGPHCLEVQRIVKCCFQPSPCKVLDVHGHKEVCQQATKSLQ